jgi:toxin ParE1/3/4
MAEFRLTPRAEDQLVEALSFTLLKFGLYQAEAYRAGFERTFGLLADFPRMGLEVDDLRPSYRRFRFQSHLIFYTPESYGVLIRQIFHGSQDIRPALFK